MMNKQFREFLESAIPFLVVGIAIAFFIALFMIFSYILLWGIVIGAILGAIAWLKNYFFPDEKTKSKKGRTIEHDDVK